MKEKKSFKKISAIIAAIFVLSAFGGCSADKTERTPVETLTITNAPKEVDLSEKTVRLGVEYTPKENVVPFAVRWHCDGQSVATVDERGVLTLVSAGKIVVTASVIGKREVSDKVAIEVTGGQTEVSSITVTGRPENDTVAFPCEPFTLSYKTDPVAEDLAVEWYSTSSATASIDENGLVRVRGKGATEIGVVSKTNKKVKDSFILYVGGAQSVRGVSIVGKPTNNTMRAGTSTALLCGYEPRDCGWFEEVWSSSEPEVATVDESGKLTAVAEGQTTITLGVKGKDVSDSFILTVGKGLDPLCEDFEYALIKDGFGYGNYRSIAKNYDDVILSLTEDKTEIPSGGSGKALKAEAASNAYAGAILTPRDGIKVGVKYRFSAKIKLLSVSGGSAYVYCNVKMSGSKNPDSFAYGGDELKLVSDGESIVLTGEFTVENADVSFEIFVCDTKHSAVAVSFTIDDVIVVEA